MGRSWIVMCRVSGGVTGTREAPLKSNGQIKEFADAAEARAEAARLTRNMDFGCSSARYQYWAEEA